MATSKIAGQVLPEDYVIEEATVSGWLYRKWKSGKIEAWYKYEGASSAFDVLSSPLRYKNATLKIPSGIFTEAPNIVATSSNISVFAMVAVAMSATSADMRFITTRGDALTPSAYIYAYNRV